MQNSRLHLLHQPVAPALAHWVKPKDCATSDQPRAFLCPQVKLVRGNLTALERSTIGALVVIDVHARDIVAEMVTEKVSSVDDFGWLSRLRWADINSNDHPYNNDKSVVSRIEMFMVWHLGRLNEWSGATLL